MKTVIKKVALEPLKTRYPVCYPSIVDGEICYLDNSNAQLFSNAFYGYIPLGVGEITLGNNITYYSFTEEMGESYGGKIIDCYNLQKWFNEFIEYYKILRSNDCKIVFSSCQEYYQRTYEYNNNEEEAILLDENFKNHGGDKFYRWLINNYFIGLDFIDEYREISGICESYDEWLTYVDNVGINFMPYPEVLNFYGKMSEMSIKYSGKDCSELGDCCDCVDYKLLGGDAMLSLLRIWIDRINSNIARNNDIIKNLNEHDRHRLIPKSQLNISLSSKVEDLGVYTIFSKEFVPERVYKKGNVCTYNDVVYICMANTYNDTEFIINKRNGWIPYYDVYIENSEHREEKDEGAEIILNGRTTSSLTALIRKEETIDTTGNTLPGYFKPSELSYFPQPGENTVLNFMYVPGTYANMEKFDEDNQEFRCDLLYSIRFYGKKNDGVELSGYTASIKDDWDGDERPDSMDDLVLLSIMNAKYEISSTDNTDGILYADFTYYKDVIIKILDVLDGNTIINVIDKESCVRCIDHCTITTEYCMYHLSNTEIYPVKYYKVNMDEESYYSDEYQKYINVCMCDVYLSGNKINNHEAYPLIRFEEFLPYQNVENTVDNIYIDRGYATALDRHLKMGEISNFDELEKYGNGAFQIFNSDEEVV